MDLRGRLYDITRDWKTGEFRVTLGVRAIPSGIDSLREKDLAISLKTYRPGRSLTANAYYWVLVAKIAEAIGQNQAIVHNILLRRYGQMKIIGGDIVTTLVLDTVEAEQEVLEDELEHLKPTNVLKEGKDGRRWRVYRVMKGSSKYDTKEMATLIDGAVSEAREMGLETLPDAEVERMMEAYEVNHARRK